MCVRRLAGEVSQSKECGLAGTMALLALSTDPALRDLGPRGVADIDRHAASAAPDANDHLGPERPILLPCEAQFPLNCVLRCGPRPED